MATVIVNSSVWNRIHDCLKFCFSFSAVQLIIRAHHNNNSQHSNNLPPIMCNFANISLNLW